MNNEITKQETQVATVTNEQLISYLDLFQSTANLNEQEKKQFIEVAKLSNLNPFKREIYITAYGSGQYRQCSIIVGYEVYIKRAEMSGLLSGWNTSFQPCKTIEVDKNTGKLKEITDYKAIVTIHRKDFEHPFVHEVLFSEYVQKTKDGKVNKFWAEKPQTMIKKVAISQGFRMCFNEVLGGLPYTKEEILTEEQTIDITEQNKELINDVDYDAILAEAEKMANRCKSVECLQKIWNKFPELEANADWKKLITDLKNKLSK